eukprot:5364740-Prymnesium_polylepis.1
MGGVVGKATHVWCPRVSVAGPAIPSCSGVAVVAISHVWRKPGLELGECPVSTVRLYGITVHHTHTHTGPNNPKAKQPTPGPKRCNVKHRKTRIAARTQTDSAPPAGHK